MKNVVTDNTNYANNNQNKTYEFFLMLFLTLYYGGSQVLSTVSWGRYFLLGCMGGLILTFGAKSGMKLRLFFDKYLKWMICFCLFCCISMVWALDSRIALEKLNTIFQIFVFSFIIYLIVRETLNLNILIKPIIFGGIILFFYLLARYGYRGLIVLLQTGTRIGGNETGNANGIGIYMVFSILASLYEIFFEKIKVYHIFIVAMFVIVIASSSRTSLLGLLVGICVLALFKFRELKKIRKIIYTLIFVIIGYVTLNFILSASIFDSIRERLDDMLAAITGAGGDHSSNVRIEMIRLGFNEFLKRPLGGSGIGNSSVLLRNAGYTYAYFHNNYIEMLSCLGVIGTMIWYYPYVSYGRLLLKNKKRHDAYIPITSSLCCSVLVMDVGAVSYYEKAVFFLIVIVFIQIARLKENRINDDYE